MKLYLDCQGSDSFIFSKLEIFVCDLEKRLVEIECETYDTIASIQDSLYEQEGVPQLICRLAQRVPDETFTWTDPPGWKWRSVRPFDEEVARDTETPTLVSDYDIKDGETLTFRLNMPGMPGSKPMPGQEHEWWWEEKRETKKFLEFAESRGLGGMHGFGMGMGLLCDQQARIHGFEDYDEQSLRMGWAKYDMSKHSEDKAMQMFKNLPAPPQTKFMINVVNGKPAVTKLGPKTPDYLTLCGASFAHMIVTDKQGLPHPAFRVIKKADYSCEDQGLEAWVKPPKGEGQSDLPFLPSLFSNPEESAVCCGATDAEIKSKLLEMHAAGLLAPPKGETYECFELIPESVKKHEESVKTEKDKNGIMRKETPIEMEYKLVEKPTEDVYNVVITFSGTPDEQFPDSHMYIKEYQRRHQEEIEARLVEIDSNLKHRHQLIEQDALPEAVAPEPHTREYRMQLHIRDLVWQSQTSKIRPLGPVEPFRLLQRGEKMPRAFEAMMGCEELLWEDDESRVGWTISQRLFAEASAEDWDLYPDEQL